MEVITVPHSGRIKRSLNVVREMLQISVGQENTIQTTDGCETMHGLQTGKVIQPALKHTFFLCWLVWTSTVLFLYTRWWPVQARVHLAANELKEYPQRHLLLLYIYNIGKIIVKIMHELIRLKFVRLNKMFKIIQNYPWSTIIWNSASHELQQMQLIIWRERSTNNKMIQVAVE